MTRNLDGQVKVPDQAPDHSQLLGVLFAEYGDVGTHQIQQLGDHRGYTAEMPRTKLAFEPLGRFDYLLARCAQAAIYRRLRALPGGLLGEEARRVLRDDVLVPAAGSGLEEWWRRAAGARPGCEAWLEDVAGLQAVPDGPVVWGTPPGCAAELEDVAGLPEKAAR